MPIQQLKKQSDLEKRLQILRRQVYGKQEFVLQKKNAPSSGNAGILTDTGYLYKDLLKILLFSSFAIAIQVLLFILLKNHILNINF